MTKFQRNSKRSKHARADVGARLRTTILNAGCPRLFVFATLLAAALASLVYYQFISAQTVANQALNQTLIEKRKQNTIARMVQETKPEFLDQFRRLVNNYSTARELLPGEAEVSNVLDAIQQMARTNHVRVTMFDASKPGAKFNNPAATATTNTGPTPASKSPQTSRPEITLNERVMPAQIQGTHANVARFLSDVAKYPRIIYVRDLSITSLNSQETVNLTLVTYDAPTSGILPPIPTELRAEFQTHAGQLPN